MIPLNANGNVDNSDLVNYPDGRIRDNDGTNNGTGVNRSVYGDLHSNISKLMRLYAITPSGLPDNETNGYQLIEALRGLASKNDFIYPLSTNGTILNVDIKFSQMLDNEYIVCLAAFNKASETQIKGIGAGTFAITYSGNFKTNEYVRVIKTSGGVSIIRVADALSLDAMVADALYLKKATQVEENTGAIDTKATTPLTNLVAFTKRVIGADSGNFLAKPTGDPDERNGLLSKADKLIIDSIGSSKTKNIGWVSGVDPGGPAGSLPTSGGGVTASTALTGGVNESTITVNFPVAMNGTQYYVKLFPQSEGSVGLDDDIGREVFRPITANQFTFTLGSTTNTTQSLKFYFETVNF